MSQAVAKTIDPTDLISLAQQNLLSLTGSVSSASNFVLITDSSPLEVHQQLPLVQQLPVHVRF